jgi:hypothetical protein
MISTPLIDTVYWGNSSEFATAVVSKAGLEFAIYDSAYASRMPIVMSSETTPQLLGQEYVAWRKTESLAERLMERLALAIGISAIETITLKSTLLQPSDAGKDQGGQMLFAFRARKGGVQVPAVQDALDIHGQDVHNSYAAKRWGELLISVSRIISKCGA